MISKRTQILELLPIHTIGEIKVKTSSTEEYIRRIANEEGLQWIKDKVCNKQTKIIELASTHTKKEIQSIVGCSKDYVSKIFKANGLTKGNRSSKKELTFSMAKDYTVAEISEKLGLREATVIRYLKLIGINSTKTKRRTIIELSDTLRVSEMIAQTGIAKYYIKEILRKEGITPIPEIAKPVVAKIPRVKKVKPIIVKPRNVAKTSKTIASKIKVSQSDMQKGNAKLTPKEKVMPTLVRDESKVRTVVLDSKTTKLLYPGQAGYDTPIEVLRSEWARKQAEGLKMLKGA